MVGEGEGRRDPVDERAEDCMAAEAEQRRRRRRHERGRERGLEGVSGFGAEIKTEVEMIWTVGCGKRRVERTEGQQLSDIYVAREALR